MKLPFRFRLRFRRAVKPDDAGSLVRALREFRPALSGLRGPIAGTMSLTLVAIGFELLRPWPIKILFDDVLLNEADPGVAVRMGLDRSGLLIGCCAAVVMISLVIGFLLVRRNVLVGYIGRKVTTRIRSRVYQHLQKLALPFHQGNRSGDLLMRLMGDVNLVRDLLFSSWAGLFERVLLFVGTTVMLFVIDWRLALVALAPIPLLVFGLGRSSAELTKVSRKQRRKEGGVAAMASESLRQIRVVKAYAAEERTARAFTKQTRSSEREGLRAIRIAAGMNRMAEIITGAGLALVLFVGAHRVLDGALKPGVVIVAISYARSLYKPVRKMSREGVRLSKATACAGRLLEILDQPTEETRTGRPVEPFRGELELESLTKQYPDGTDALRGISIRVPPGSLAVLSGPNGAGKSTLMSMMLRLVEPTSGRILIDGTSIDEWDLDGYRGRIAYVPQDLLLFGGTVRENLLFGRPDATDDEVEEAASAALASDFIDALPEGMETPLGENGARLSGGEARRLMLARAALRDADVLLLDEPLAGLDPEARSVVARCIRRIANGRTTIVVNHGDAGEIAPDLEIKLDAGRVAKAPTVAKWEA